MNILDISFTEKHAITSLINNDVDIGIVVVLVEACNDKNDM